jgi:hypothetical protein
MESIYIDWEKTCVEIVSTNMKNWKQHPHVFNMLEHLPFWIGEQYLQNLIKNEGVELSLIQEISNLNDVDGSNCVDFTINNQKVTISPTTIRYLSHSIDILNLLKKNNVSTISMIEIGAGYGGLALIINYLSRKQKYNLKIKKYYIYDLPSVQNLQKYYLSRHNFLHEFIEWKDSSFFGSDLKDDNNDELFLISNYALSEMNLEYRKKYLENILPIIKGAYMLWNSQNMEGLPFRRIEKEENPKTGEHNKIITLI